MPKALDNTPWTGAESFIVGLDIGTAHSSVTFSHLENGKLPQNYRVTHWPAATGAGGSSDAKTASMLYYDKNLQLKAAGAAVSSPTMRHNAKVNGWHLVRYFKLQLHPSTMIKPQDFKKFHFEALPEGLDVERVYADMIRYLMDHTRDFLEQRNGTGTWWRLSRIMKLVIAHPNGWGFKEQGRLRAAVVQANVFGEREAKEKVKFVSEAEAAVHYILWEKSQELQPGDEVVVCDAGGSTADTTAYRVEKQEILQPSGAYTVGQMNNIGTPPPSPGPPKKKGFRLFRKKTKPDVAPVLPSPQVSKPQPKTSIQLKETKASDCQPAGGVFVNEALVAYLKDRFYDLPPDQAEALKQCLQKSEESFELNCKREFSTGRDAPSEYVVETGAGIPGYVDSSLLIDAEVLKGLFEEPVDRIIASIEKQTEGINPQYIFLVGGFGTSKYLRQRVEETCRRGRRRVLFLDDAHGKAASDGSVIWYIRRDVTARAVRMSFGVSIHVPYNLNSREHEARPREYLADGAPYVEGSFAIIAKKDHVIDENLSRKRTYVRKYSSPNPDLGEFSINLYAWTNDTRPSPEWVTDPEGNLLDGFEQVCSIEADMSGTKGGLVRHRGKKGDYWALDFDVCIEFGGTELSAYLEWKERGITRRGEATVVEME